jgi:hypothetical protein
MDRITTTSTITKTGAMSRPKGSGKLGPVRSLRLPFELDEWFEERLRDEAARPASEILLDAVHGGLRLQPGYMGRQHLALSALAVANDLVRYESYVRALADSFGSTYVKHLEAWLAADGILPFESRASEIDAIQPTANVPATAPPIQPD